MQYREFEDASYTSLRKDLLKSKGSSLQKEFLETLQDSSSFDALIRGKVDFEKGHDLVLLPHKLTESEFKEPPSTIEESLVQEWLNNITPKQASRVTFWANVALEHINAGIIKASYLAANGGSSLPDGLTRIDKAFKSGKPKEIDDIVRSVIRRMSGLPEARGNKSVYVNCPFSRAWWRGYIAQEVCRETNADYNKVIKTLRHSQGYWEELINLVVSKNSVLGDSNVRTALIWALSELIDDKKYAAIFNTNSLQQIAKLIGIRSAWQELAVFEPKDLKLIIEQEFI